MKLQPRPATANTKAGDEESQHGGTDPSITVSISYHKVAVWQHARELLSRLPPLLSGRKSTSNEELSAHPLPCVLLTNYFSDRSTLKWIFLALPLKVNPHAEGSQLQPREAGVMALSSQPVLLQVYFWEQLLKAWLTWYSHWTIFSDVPRQARQKRNTHFSIRIQCNRWTLQVLTSPIHHHSCSYCCNFALGSTSFLRWRPSTMCESVQA